MIISGQLQPTREYVYFKVKFGFFADLPGFTRSVYKRDHALITPESHVFSPLSDWYLQFLHFLSFFLRMFDFVIWHIDLLFDRTNTLGAYLITPAMGSHFVMYLAKMQGLVLFESILLEKVHD